MNESSQYQCYLFLVLVASTIDFSLSYTKLSADNEKLCSPTLQKRTIGLGTESLSGLVVTLGRISEHPLSWETNFVCTFRVDAFRSHSGGIFAVIQNIVFRKNETTDDCIDYVQYKRHDGSASKKYCGRLTSALGMDPIFAPERYATNLAPTANSFVDPKGQLDVVIYIAREPLHVHEEMELKIVFTSYRYCYTPMKSDKKCSEKYENECIYKDFFDDGFVNCPFPECVDEHGCSEKVYEVSKTSVGNKVIIGSVTLLVGVFVLFICFIWLCRKYKKLCWADDFASPNVTQSSRTTELSETPPRNTPMSSSAAVPSTTIGSSFLEEDKDLPPSYASLFPDR